MRTIRFIPGSAKAIAGIFALMTALLAGCSSSQEAGAASAANAAAQNASANVANNLNQNLTAANSSTASTPAAAASPLTGQWIRTGTVYNQDGTISKRVINTLMFSKNGVFTSVSPSGVNSQFLKSGTYRVSGNTLTINLGAVQQTSKYQIQGSTLAIIAPNKSVTVFMRP